MKSMQQFLRGMALLMAITVLVTASVQAALPSCLIRKCGNFTVWEEFAGTGSKTYRATTAFSPIQGSGNKAVPFGVCCPNGSKVAVCNMTGKLKDLGMKSSIEVGTAKNNCFRPKTNKLCVTPFVARTVDPDSFMKTGKADYNKFSCLVPGS